MTSPSLYLHIPLMSAYLCQDCNCIGNSSRQCPACASEVLMNLATVLDREVLDREVEIKVLERPRLSYSCRPSLVA
jgi:hypothetical protein